MSRAFAIRPATAGDIPAMAAVLTALDEPIGWPGLPGWPYLEHLVKRASVVVAVDTTEALIGFAGAIDVGGPETRWLTDLFVHPESHERGAGRALLDLAVGDAPKRMTASSADQRALGLYLRAGMRPWWPFLYLQGEVGRLPATDRDIEVEAADAEETARLSRGWTGVDRSADFAHYASLPGAVGFIVRDAGAAAAVGWARSERRSAGRWLDHVSIAPDADPVRTAVAAWLAASPDGGPVRGVVPGPHPAVPVMLDHGIRIVDRDTFCATDRDLLDPVRILPNQGFL